MKHTKPCYHVWFFIVHNSLIFKFGLFLFDLAFFSPSFGFEHPDILPTLIYISSLLCELHILVKTTITSRSRSQSYFFISLIKSFDLLWSRIHDVIFHTVFSFLSQVYDIYLPLHAEFSNTLLHADIPFRACSYDNNNNVWYSVHSKAIWYYYCLILLLLQRSTAKNGFFFMGAKQGRIGYIFGPGTIWPNRPSNCRKCKSVGRNTQECQCLHALTNFFFGQPALWASARIAWPASPPLVPSCITYFL